jgi:serine protease inhibitor
MLFFGARGSTYRQINEILKMDEMISFNPHLIYKNIINDTLTSTEKRFTGASTKHLLVSKNASPLSDLYKLRVQYFYGPEIESVNFDNIEDEISKRVNTVVSSQTKDLLNNLITEEDEEKLKSDSPLAVVMGNYLKGSFFEQAISSTMEFITLPRGRNLVTIPSVYLKGSFNAGYEEGLGVTAVEIPYIKEDLSLILMLPGKISEFLVNGLDKIEENLDTNTWENILESFVLRNLEVQVPKLKTHCVLNLNETLVSLGVDDSFSEQADFSGINGAEDLKISSFFQVNELSIDASQSTRIKRKVKEKAIIDKVISMITRNSRQEETYQLSFERQFMYIVRHNPTGLVLYIGRYHHPPDHQDHGHRQQR